MSAWRRGAALGCGVVVLCGVWASGQSTGGTRGGGTTTPTPTPPRPTNPTGPSTSGRDPSSTTTEMRRQIYVSGQVMMAEGGAPPEPVVIQLLCAGQHRPQGYTDSKGRFGFTLGNDRSLVPDASVGTYDWTSSGTTTTVPQPGMTDRQLMGCELRAELPGFRSDTISLNGRRSMDRPEVGVILLHRLANVEGFTFSMTSANAPKEAQKAYEKGLDLKKKRKLKEAEAALEKAVGLYPKYAVAWYELGETRRLAGAASEEPYLKAVEADGKYLKPHLELLHLSTKTQDWALIGDRAATVIRLDPGGYPAAWFCQAVAQYNRGQVEEAEKSVRESLKLDEGGQVKRSRQLLAEILKKKGDAAGALVQMRAYAELAGAGPEGDAARRQVRLLEELQTARRE